MSLVETIQLQILKASALSPFNWWRVPVLRRVVKWAFDDLHEKGDRESVFE